MDLYVDHSTVEDIGVVRLRQMVFVHNALDDGWSVHKNGNNYVFKKKAPQRQGNLPRILPK